MSYLNTIEVCRAKLFTKGVELRERYPQALVDKVLRVREMYNWFNADPDGYRRPTCAEYRAYSQHSGKDFLNEEKYRRETNARHT